MSVREYRMYYTDALNVMESTRYTLADSDIHAENNFKCIIPNDNNRDWRQIEMFCPYRDKWIIVREFNVESVISQ